MLCGIAIANGADIRQMIRNGDFSIDAGDLNFGSGISVGNGQFGGDSGYTVCAEGEESFPAAKVERLDVGWIAGSVSGSLDCDFPSLRGVYGDHAMFSMNVDTTSGDLDIRKN